MSVVDAMAPSSSNRGHTRPVAGRAAPASRRREARLLARMSVPPRPSRTARAACEAGRASRSCRPGSQRPAPPRRRAGARAPDAETRRGRRSDRPWNDRSGRPAPSRAAGRPLRRPLRTGCDRTVPACGRFPRGHADRGRTRGRAGRARSRCRPTPCLRCRGPCRIRTAGPWPPKSRQRRETPPTSWTTRSLCFRRSSAVGPTAPGPPLRPPGFGPALQRRRRSRGRAARGGSAVT